MGSFFNEDADDPFASLMMGGGLGGMPNGSKRPRPSHAARADILPPGTLVRLTGLSSESLNGKTARVLEWHPQRARYVVGLSADDSSIAIKPSNVRQLISDARVVGTSKQELNGRVAASATYDAS